MGRDQAGKHIPDARMNDGTGRKDCPGRGDGGTEAVMLPKRKDRESLGPIPRGVSPGPWAPEDTSEGREQSWASALKKGTRSSRLREGQCGPVTGTFSLQAETPEHGGEWRRATGGGL